MSQLTTWVKVFLVFALLLTLFEPGGLVSKQTEKERDKSHSAAGHVIWHQGVAAPPIEDRECLIMEAAHHWKYLLLVMINYYFLWHIKIFFVCGKTPIEDKECLIMEAAHHWKYLLLVKVNYYLLRNIEIIFYMWKNTDRG